LKISEFPVDLNIKLGGRERAQSLLRSLLSPYFSLVRLTRERGHRIARGSRVVEGAAASPEKS
jgi:hypothetical protein